MKRQKGQAGAEFVIIVGVLVLIAMFLLPMLSAEAVKNAPAAAEAIDNLSAYSWKNNTHAEERHVEAGAAANALSDPCNILSVWFNPETRRYCLVAEDETGLYVGVQEECGDTVTCFGWRKFFIKLVCYLDGRGYVLCNW